MNIRPAWRPNPYTENRGQTPIWFSRTRKPYWGLTPIFGCKEVASRPVLCVQLPENPLETTDEPLARQRHARHRPFPRLCRHRRPGPAAGRQADDQGTEDDDGAHGEEQPREVLRG